MFVCLRGWQLSRLNLLAVDEDDDVVDAEFEFVHDHRGNLVPNVALDLDRFGLAILRLFQGGTARELLAKYLGRRGSIDTMEVEALDDCDVFLLVAVVELDHDLGRRLLLLLVGCPSAGADIIGGRLLAALSLFGRCVSPLEAEPRHQLHEFLITLNVRKMCLPVLLEIILALLEEWVPLAKLEGQ